MVHKGGGGEGRKRGEADNNSIAKEDDDVLKMITRDAHGDDGYSDCIYRNVEVFIYLSTYLSVHICLYISIHYSICSRICISISIPMCLCVFIAQSIMRLMSADNSGLARCGNLGVVMKV